MKALILWALVMSIVTLAAFSQALRLFSPYAASSLFIFFVCFFAVLAGIISGSTTMNAAIGLIVANLCYCLGLLTDFYAGFVAFWVAVMIGIICLCGFMYYLGGTHEKDKKKRFSQNSLIAAVATVQLIIAYTVMIRDKLAVYP